jgi:hypothetical protein
MGWATFWAIFSQTHLAFNWNKVKYPTAKNPTAIDPTVIDPTGKAASFSN